MPGSPCFTRPWTWTLLRDNPNNNTNTIHLQHTTLRSFSRLTPLKTLHNHTASKVPDPCRTSSSSSPTCHSPGHRTMIRAPYTLRETALSKLPPHIAHDGFFCSILVKSQTSKLPPCTVEQSPPQHRPGLDTAPFPGSHTKKRTMKETEARGVTEKRQLLTEHCCCKGRLEARSQG